MAWISSTITVRTLPSPRRPDSDVSRMKSDSGVVTSTCGGRLAPCRRSAADVSPVRTAVRMSRAPAPISVATARSSPSGSSRLRRMSLERARSGETYTTSVASSRTPDAACRTRASRQWRKAASVLPEPVGAVRSTSCPLAMTGHPSAWMGVGSTKRLENHASTTGWNMPPVLPDEATPAQGPPDFPASRASRRMSASLPSSAGKKHSTRSSSRVMS